MHRGEIVYNDGLINIINCTKCGYIHVIPLSDESNLDAYYESNYEDFLKTKEKMLKDELWYRKTIWNDMVINFKKFINEYPIKLIDIGCGRGDLLKYMKENNIESTGIEPSIQAYKDAKSLALNVYNVSFDNYIKKTHNNKIKYHVVVLNYVLEHVLDPYNFLNNCRKILNDNGIIYLRVPNDFNVLQYASNQNVKIPFWWVSLPDHINYFTFNSLERLVEKVGFEIISKSTSFPMELFLLFGDDYTSNSEIGDKSHEKRVRFETTISEDFRRDFYKTLALNNIGRDCILYARKKT